MFLHLSVSNSVNRRGQYLPGQVHPLGRYPPSNACWDTVYKRAVRILLECIVVIIYAFLWANTYGVVKIKVIIS